MEEYYTRYYSNQTGGGDGNTQYLQLKIPRHYQKGRGLGGIFNSLWRFLQPLLKKGASFASKELLETGSDILSGISSQTPIKTVLANRSINLVDKIRDKAAEKIKTMAGAGSKRKRNNKHINSNTKKKCNHFVSFSHSDKKEKSKKKNQKIKNKTTRVLDIFT